MKKHWTTNLVKIPFSKTAHRELDDDGFQITNEVTVVDAGQTSSERRYIKFEQAERREWVDIDLFCPCVTPGILELKKRGIRVFLKRDQDAISEHVAQRTLYREVNILERIGWLGLYFALPDGSSLSSFEEQLPVAYCTGAVNVSVRGTTEDFRRNVAKFVKDQHIMLFCMMVSLAAPLVSLSRIQGNFGFMLSGPARKGKTTGLEIAAAIWGPALDGPGGRYYLKFNNTQNRIGELMPFYNDMPLIIDELSSHGTRASRLDGFRTLIHHLAGVDGKGRYGDDIKPAEQTRTVFLISSNDGINELLAGESEDAAEGAVDRLFEIPVPRGDEGCFNATDAKFPDRRDYAEEVRARVGLYHGASARTYLAEAAELREVDDDYFRKRLNDRIAEFAKHPEVRALGRVSSRSLDAFGLVCAAGALGVVTGVLPKTCDPFAAALHCLRLHLGSRAELDPVQRLLGWVSANKVIDLRGRRLPAMSDEALNQRGAFIGECHGIPQLWMAPKLFKFAFPNGIRLLRDLKQRHVLKPEGKGSDSHLTVKCMVRIKDTAKDPQDRLHVFMIPDLEEWLEQNGYSRSRQKRR